MPILTSNASVANSKVINGLTWWGDSLSAGAGGNGITAPGELSKLLKIKVINRGVGGEGSSEIAVRSGARTLKVKFWGSGIRQGDWMRYEVVPDRLILRQGANVLAGSIGKCLAILKFEGNSYSITLYKCQRDLSNSTAIFDIVGLETTNTKYQIIWSGRNNAGDSLTVANDISAMVNRFKKINPAVKIYVLSIINGAGEGTGTSTYSVIQGANKSIETLGLNYIDVRHCLISRGLEIEKLLPTELDLKDIQDDLVPTQLRSDNIHLNAYGYHAVAKCVYDFIKGSFK